MGGREEDGKDEERGFLLKGIDAYAFIALILPIVNLPLFHSSILPFFQPSILLRSESPSRLKGIETVWMEVWKTGRLVRHFTS